MLRNARRLLLILLVVGLGRSASAGDPAVARDFGAGITLDRATPLSEVLAAPERFEGAPLLLRGRIAEVCQRKGCWTILQDGEARVRVRFVDYGFFLPRDCMGDQALVQGMVRVETLSEADARHYEAETRGGDPTRIQGPQREVGFLASGVRLAPPAATGAP